MVTRKRFEARVRELCAGHAMLERICCGDAAGASDVADGVRQAAQAMLAIVRKDEVCRRLMTVPGVGALVAITFKTGVDDPSRIDKSKAVAHYSD